MREAIKPLMNLDEVEFDDIEDNGYFTSRRGQISDHIGARRLGYNLTELPPGKAQCPFHNHHGEEEMFLILEGEGELRFGDQRFSVRRHDVIACPTGGPETAHQIINTGSTTMRYLALSNVVDIEVCEYPDSGKLLVASGPRGQRGLRKIYRAEDEVDYYERESNVAPPRDAG
ncbi:cupin domain-containing protein [Roseateles violae]|uniref:Cupin domain-containing protein n=1 Tax=Roseateles violae TaxID=3058042 RepID=A0ABT8DR82_9BURK|nr:cupin domain-containing protein [Pelomonas sp. PFR6]MDN3919588.1 cupin domain-containing protein [Pelomonas sp. PFR6]